MNNVILFDDEAWREMLPVTLTRPIADIRIGILKISEKWERHLKARVSYITQDFLSEKYPIHISSDNYVINSRWLPNPRLLSLIKTLSINDALLYEDVLVAARMNQEQFQRLIDNVEIEELKGVDISNNTEKFNVLSRPHQIFEFNSKEIESDIELLRLSSSKDLPSYVQLIGKDPVYVDKTATLYPCTINTEEGPVYIGKNSSVLEGSSLRGPLAVCEGSQIKMGAKIYGGTTVGPFCKVGGEVSNSVFQGYANKAHDGYLGNAVIGEWCNLGAGTNNSNLKNNYSEVKLWNYKTKKFEKTGSIFCGLIMGDHSKCGINTMFNTGTVVGVSANIFGSGYPRNFIPSYSWGGAQGYKSFRIESAIELAEIVMKRRNKTLEQVDKMILEHIFHATAHYRNWES